MSNDRIREFFVEFSDLARQAANEEELRSAFRAAAISKLGIRDLKLERGRQDVRRNRIIIEFKDKGLFNKTQTSAKFQESLRQIVDKYIPMQAAMDSRDKSDYIGVCFDGVSLAFVFIETDERVRLSDLREFDEKSAAVLAAALDNDNRLELTPENFINDFGPESIIARDMIKALWEDLNVLLDRKTNRVQMLFEEWNDLFAQTTGLGDIGKAKMDRFLASIGLPSGADLTRVLFVLHTYHATVFKMLAAEMVLANKVIPTLPAEYCFGVSTLDDVALAQTLERDIEESDLFRQANILNFVEGSFFSWYLVNPSVRLMQAVRAALQRLVLYRLTGLKHSRTRDIIKEVYQELVPPVLRHNIGEYFTPEWLVEFTLDRAGYCGSQVLSKKYLDPTCGSGSFLIHAINRYKEAARSQGWTDSQIMQGILDHIYGFDLNPLAVLTSRVNYLLALSEFMCTASDIEIPVYQADAVYSPTISTKTPAAKRTRVYQIGTRKKTVTIELPEDLIQCNRLFARVLEIMERSIRYGYSKDAFMYAIRAELDRSQAASVSQWEPWLLKMYSKIEQLEKMDWNRIWCRIVRNYFASVAVGQCQVVAGNPPWVRWSELPERYRERIKPTCESYDIFSRDRFFGGNELDISAMITYTVADRWLADKGILAFVITQTHFQSQSSGGFRKFSFGDTQLRVLSVDDFVQVKPWPRLGNKPAVITLLKGKATTYPVPYLVWRRRTSKYLSEDDSLDSVRQFLEYRSMEANRLSGEGQRWSILDPGLIERLLVLDGEDPNIVGRKGIVTDLNGVYFVELLGPGRRPETVRFRTRPQESRQSIPQRTDEIEFDLVYPLIKGAKNISAFRATTSSLFAIVPNKQITVSGIPVESVLARDYPAALSYLKAINSSGLLERRSTWRTRQAPVYRRLVAEGKISPSEVPFYAIYDVGPYTFAPYKVVWAELAGSLQAAVISSAEVPFGGGRKPIVPDHKVYFAAFYDEDHAHYVCALLNSKPVRTFVDSLTIKLQVGTLFRHVRLPAYDAGCHEHLELAAASKAAHESLRSKSGKDFPYIVEAIDCLANRVLGTRC
ncbi:MAG: N-6 DNA methylase [Firmicutes bacterium]|nr:N-6 DNA methylase [Bacillota bacterium]